MSLLSIALVIGVVIRWMATKVLWDGWGDPWAFLRQNVYATCVFEAVCFERYFV